MHTALDILLRRDDIWQASRQRPRSRGVPTGYAELDRRLHDGGWPMATLTELLVGAAGGGEWQLLLPVLARHTGNGDRCALVAPPWRPCASALCAAGIDLRQLLIVEPRDEREQLWATEQILRANAFATVVVWFGRTPLRTAQLRRLQLAVRHGNTLAFLYRDRCRHREASIAGLRIETVAAPPRLHLLIHKQRGGWGGQSISLERREPWFNASSALPPATSTPYRAAPFSPIATPELPAARP